MTTVFLITLEYVIKTMFNNILKNEILTTELDHLGDEQS